MEETLRSRLKRSWNAFMNRDPTSYYDDIGSGSYHRPDRPRLTRGNERSIVNSIYNRIALDVASIDIKHVRLDENGRYLEEVDSGLNNCLTLEANIDQTARAFKQDVVMSMFDEGVVALVPIDTSDDPNKTGSYDIHTMRTGKIVQWYPRHVKVRVYNDRTGRKEEVTISKSSVAIIENPLYSVMNEPNSTMQRLIRKLNLLDVIDEQSGSGKLDLIVQLPYAVKGETRAKQADARRDSIIKQLKGPYGIAYIDSTEKVTQLNRPIENNLMKQIEFLTNMLYGQLGISQAVMDGTADEKQMLNYNNRTIEPIVASIVDAIKRSFLTKTARSQKQTITSFRDPFRLVPVNDIAEIADKFTRNEIMTSNEIRQIIGMKPADDPKADMLVNSNLNQSNQTMSEEMYDEPYEEEVEEIQNE